MKTYEYNITVASDDIDALEHVNNVRYVQWVQDAAEAHWKALASQEMQQKYIWMVLSHHITYKGQAFLNDEILVKTYVENSEGATSTRVVEMHHARTNKLLVYAKTNWCLLDQKSKRPIRMDENLKMLFHRDTP